MKFDINIDTVVISFPIKSDDIVNLNRWRKNMETKENLTLEEILKIHHDIIRQISQTDLNELMIKEIRVVFDEEEYIERINNGEKTGKQGFCDLFYKKKL